MPPVSVIICTHNPRPDYLRRVLNGLEAQTLPASKWELLVIDNASREPLCDSWDLSWHPLARHIRENETGLTPARLCAIREATGELLVFVDDDNILDAAYLVTAAKLAEDHPQIGAFGASIKGDYEIPPPEFIRPYLFCLAIYELDDDHISNAPQWSLATPYGAGMCIRRLVAKTYAEQVADHPLRKSLGRSGAHLGAGEDTDIALIATDLGMKTARFHNLKLTHLIPKERLTEAYLVKICAGFSAAEVVLSAIRPHSPLKSRATLASWVRQWYNYLTKGPFHRKLLRVSSQARKRARNQLRSNRPQANPKISIIMPSYNQGAYLEEAIRSVLNQNYPNKELIVIDGGSTDNSVEILKSYGPQLAYWVSEPDRGQSHALNKALQKATGEIIGWLNSDDYYLPGAFRRIVRAFRQNQNAVLVHGNRILVDYKSRVVGWSAMAAYDPASSGYTISSETAFWKKTAGDSLSFDENLRFAMDFSFFCRLYHVGPFVKLPAYLGAFRGHEKSKSSTIQDICETEGAPLWKAIFPDLPDGSKIVPYSSRWKLLLMLLCHPRIIALPYLYRRFVLGLRGAVTEN